MTAGDLAKQKGKASAVIVLTYSSWNIVASALAGLSHL